MSRLMDDIMNLSKQVGGFGDGPHLREQIQDDVKAIMATSQKVRDGFASMGKDSPGMSKAKANFEAMKARMQNELPQVIGKLRQSQEVSLPPPSAAPIYTEPLLSQEQLDSETEFLRTMETAAAQILSMMRETERLFTQTLEEIQKQRHKLIGIEKYTANSLSDMEQGNEQLDKAAGHQKSTSKCLCWIAIICAVILTGIILIIVWQLKWKKSST